jgi:hypothetical protein
VGVPPLPPTKPGSPPPNPTTILRQVQADLAQLSAIQDYAQARVAVANAQRSVALAVATLQTAQAAQARAQAGQQAAQNHLGVATARVRDLAVAAYMGLGFLTPAAGPQQVQESQTGTVSTPGGLTGSAAMDTTEMLRVVAQRERQDFQASRVAVREAGRASKTAAQQVADTRSSVAAAQSALAASNQTLAVVINAAKTPGLAASLNLPGLPGLADLGANQSPLTGSTFPPGGPASGLSALGAPAATASTASTVSTGPGATSATTAGVNAAGGTGSAAQATPSSPAILGPAVLSGAEMAGWFASTGRKAHTTVPMPQLADDYAQAGQQTHVRADLAFAQSIIETAFFSFPAGGQLTPKDNNFAGIGACDTCAQGWSFPDALTGVTAQMQLLDAYASPVAVPTNLVGNVGIGGCCPTWMELAGTWASNLEYGIEILTIYHQMLSWVVPQRLVAAGLLAPPQPASARPPTTAAAKAGTGAGSTPPSLPAQPALAAQAVKPGAPASP